MVSTTHISKGFSAKTWLDHCIATIGCGKGGGRADQANGSIPGGLTVLNQILGIAKEYSDRFSL